MLILSAGGRVEMRRRDDWRECDRECPGHGVAPCRRLLIDWLQGRKHMRLTRPEVTCRAREPGSVGPYRNKTSVCLSYSCFI